MKSGLHFKGCVEMQVIAYMAVHGDKWVMMRIYEFMLS